jgi:hypothetical protein
MRHSMTQPSSYRHPEPAGDLSLSAGRGVFLFPRPTCRVELSHARWLRFEYRRPPEAFLPSRKQSK